MGSSVTVTEPCGIERWLQKRGAWVGKDLQTCRNVGPKLKKISRILSIAWGAARLDPCFDCRDQSWEEEPKGKNQLTDENERTKLFLWYHPPVP